jgi:glycosyltransferase involved in cell wall biosynthesis
MQEIKKRRIVLASILKPANDPRMFEKMGQTLARDYEVHIIGYACPPAADDHQITFHSIGPFPRISWLRFFSPWQVMVKVLNLRPSLLIICTHELLFSALILKLLTGCRVIYDVQENYALNIYYGSTVPPILKAFLASYVRLKEWLLSSLPDHFLLAEKSYAEETRFIGKQCTVLENKLKRVNEEGTVRLNSADGNIHLLFSGTLAESTGVFVAIDLASALHQIDRRIRLRVCGYAAQPKIRERLRSAASNKSFIKLQGIESLVPHDQIIREIQSADFGVVSYPLNVSTRDAIPTKLFEYLGYKLPMLLIDHRPWIAYCEAYPAAVVFKPQAYDAQTILHQMYQTHFFISTPGEVFWDDQEEKLRLAVGNVLSL